MRPVLELVRTNILNEMRGLKKTGVELTNGGIEKIDGKRNCMHVAC